MITFLLALPWLNPFSFGPTPPVAQGLVVWLAAVLSWMLCGLSPIDQSLRVRLISTAWLLAGVASAALGLFQYFGLSDGLSPWVNYLEAGQAYANLRQRNQLATLLAIGLSSLLWSDAKLVPGAAFGATSQRAAWGCGVIMLVTADAASGSRTGLVQLLLLLLLALLWKRRRVEVTGVLLTYTLAAIVLPQLAGLDPQGSGILRRFSESTPICASRLTLWTNVLHLIGQKPWTGWGWGELGYAHFITLYPGNRFCEIMGNAHNLPLHLAVTLGVPFAVLACGAFAFLLWRAQPWLERRASRQTAWSVLAVIGIHSLLEYPLWYGPFQLAAVIAIWILWSTRSRRKEPHHRSAWSWGIAISLLLALSYVAWDYWRVSQIYLPVTQRAPAYRDETLEKISYSWMFQDQVKFAALSVTPLTHENAIQIHALALEMLHFSPENMVVEKLIESDRILGLKTEEKYLLERYKAAYPSEFSSWLEQESAARHKTP
ncbi:Wzy polymerase domain-containing protein [Rhodoferax sp. GW822-FHT02A01]|uniref:PglL family O-oligosaccharyltransferase n=1 Tax=Rhodoferax sp. GW822-FHT02A01 TaxID=3141537 RepID=UPI00315DC9D4